MKRIFFSVFGIALLVAPSFSFANELTADDKKGLTECLEDWVTSFNKHDAAAVAAGYTENADMMGTDSISFRGRSAIQKSYAEYFEKNPNVRSKISGVSRRVLAPNIVAEDGTWEESGHSEPNQPTKGLYCSIIVKKNGKWTVIHERAWVPVKAKAKSQ